MPGGYIYEKTIQAGTEKSLLIEPKYLYQVPFEFGDDWEDIKLGLFVSYTITGLGNENVGVPDSTITSAGGLDTDGFNYIGITRQAETYTLPFDATNSGYLGIQSDGLNTRDTTSVYYNKLFNTSVSSQNAGIGKFIATHGTGLLDSENFAAGEGNPNVVLLRSADAEVGDSSTENQTLFCDYWGFRYQVINKGLSSQKIRVTVSIDGASSNDNRNLNGISNPSMSELINLMNGVGEYRYEGSSNMKGSNTNNGFKWNDNSTGYALPDSLYFFNGFQGLRPRIHAWAIKKFS
jgi:hypothetical protein